MTGIINLNTGMHCLTHKYNVQSLRLVMISVQHGIAVVHAHVHTQCDLGFAMRKS